MADDPDAGLWARYPSMQQPAPEAEPPISAGLRARFPSMSPTGHVADKRLVPRHPPADAGPAAVEAEPDLPADEAAKWRARYPSMFPDEPAKPAAAEPAAAAPGGEPAAPDTTSAAEVPPEYQGIAPENFTVDEKLFAPVAATMREAGFSREQAAVALQLHAAEVEREDRAISAMRAGWQTESEKLVTTPEAKQALSVAMRGASPAVREVLDSSGLGSHPAVVEWILGLGRRLAGVAAPADPRNRYPSMRGSH
jgi:hypothetical protein